MPVQQYINTFLNILGNKNLSVIKSPGRINIIGEHTDYNKGWCLPAAIEQSIYFGFYPSTKTEIISIHQNKHWSLKENINSPDWAIYFKGVIDVLHQNGFDWPDFKMVFDGDLPSGAGLSSSSAITCGFIFSLNQMADLKLTTEQLTAFAVQAEKASGLEGGMMDQISIFHGRKDHALFIQCANWKFEYIHANFPDVSWIIVDTKVKHKLVDSDYNNRSRICFKMLQQAKELFPEINSLSELNGTMQHELDKKLSFSEKNYLDYLLSENKRVLEMSLAMRETNFTNMGNLLYGGHEGLRKQYRVSCRELDFMVNFAKHSRMAYGARMMGGGFGGCTLHLIDKETVKIYTDGLSNAYNNRFGFKPDIYEAILDDGVKQLQ